jgi:hypothetical protein
MVMTSLLTTATVLASYEAMIEKSGHRLNDAQKDVFAASLNEKLEGGVSREEMAQVLHDTNRVYQEAVAEQGEAAQGHHASDLEFNVFIGTEGYEASDVSVFAVAGDEDGVVQLVDSDAAPRFSIKGPPVNTDQAALVEAGFKPLDVKIRGEG